MRRFVRLSIVALFAVFAFTACQEEESLMVPEAEMQDDVLTQVNGQIIPGEYIVVFKESSVDEGQLKSMTDYKTANKFMSDFAKEFLADISPNKSAPALEHVFSKTLYGFSAKLEDEMIERIKADDRVKFFEPNRVVIMRPPWERDPVEPDPGDGEDGGDTGTSTQEIPWGITRVNGGVDATGLTAWVIDTGIDLDHPDLNVDETRGFTAFTRGQDKTFDDGNGHGTHCAGTIAGIDNNFGVVGVAANATVVPVKVLDSRGSGGYDGVIAGVDHVAAYASAGDVANMSLGGPISEALDQAVYNASQQGIKFALAAGNESADANNSSPARVNGANIYTISAMDVNDYFAYFSNYGNPPVDYCTPGVNIYSTYKDGGYATLSGTSMASPHAAGILLLGNFSTSGTVNGDPDGNADPIMVH